MDGSLPFSQEAVTGPLSLGRIISSVIEKVYVIYGRVSKVIPSFQDFEKMVIVVSKIEIVSIALHSNVWLCQVILTCGMKNVK